MKGFKNLWGKPKTSKIPEDLEDAATVSPRELTDEIMDFRQKKAAFDATNEHDTYLILMFSCKKDKILFLENAKLDAHTTVDGYELCNNFQIEPRRPSVKLPKPLGE